MVRKQRLDRAFRINTPADFEAAFDQAYFFQSVPLAEVVGRIFPDESEGRAFYLRYRESFTAQPGERHILWWAYESPIPFPVGMQDIALYEAGLMSDAELAACRKQLRANHGIEI